MSGIGQLDVEVVSVNDQLVVDMKEQLIADIYTKLAYILHTEQKLQKFHLRHEKCFSSIHLTRSAFTSSKIQEFRVLGQYDQLKAHDLDEICGYDKMLSDIKVSLDLAFADSRNIRTQYQNDIITEWLDNVTYHRRYTSSNCMN
jgi:hypothetical protein